MAQYNFKYFQEQYGVPARRNAPVMYKGRKAKVTATAGPYLKLKFKGALRGDKGAYHPTWEITWLENPALTT
jgi:hypothetical protein